MLFQLIQQLGGLPQRVLRGCQLLPVRVRVLLLLDGRLLGCFGVFGGEISSSGGGGLAGGGLALLLLGLPLGLLLLPLLVLLALFRTHGRQLVALLVGVGGVVGEVDVDLDGGPGGLEEGGGGIQAVLHAQQVQVRPQGHLADAVRMEVELVLLELREVLRHRQQVLQRPAIVLAAEPGTAALDLVPHALHVEQAVHLVPVLSKHGCGGFRPLHVPRPELRLRCRAVQEPVIEVHAAGSVGGGGGALQVAGVLQHLGLEGVQLHQRRRVLHALPQQLQRPPCVTEVVEVLRQVDLRP
mmetsp:Transcript_15251/g.46072  ORF Transcript_15251/g.46072 Transcript_15251/m.46072 type:complete len:297 (-) Transcript_15251:1394-2284(-)